MAHGSREEEAAVIGLHRILRNVAQYLGLSAVLLIPCFWQSRIQAGDLSSHVYNAWLAQLIRQGKVPGLEILWQNTNVLFDLLLSALFGWLGAAASQRIAVSACVLILVWGAFVLASGVARRAVWNLLPCLAMLAYGWTFHMGLFNFYLSLGLCFWALAWLRRKERRLWAAAFLLPAFAAHALPVAWAVCVSAYVLLAERLPPQWRWYLPAAAAAGIVVLRLILVTSYRTQWSYEQVSSLLGSDQVWVYGAKYYAVLVALLFLWAFLFLRLLAQRRAGEWMREWRVQVTLLTGFALVVLPDAVFFPGYENVLAYIGERMSLAVGVCVCALLGEVKPVRLDWAAAGFSALLFFGFLYGDERALNRAEDRIEAAVRVLPAGQRVFAAITDRGSRVNGLAHALDRICIGRCFSYANYEPSTEQFRVRALAPNPYVIADYTDSYKLQNGGYVVKAADLPLYQVTTDGSGKMIVKPCVSGQRVVAMQGE